MTKCMHSFQSLPAARLPGACQRKSPSRAFASGLNEQKKMSSGAAQTAREEARAHGHSHSKMIHAEASFPGLYALDRKYYSPGFTECQPRKVFFRCFIREKMHFLPFFSVFCFTCEGADRFAFKYLIRLSFGHYYALFHIDHPIGHFPGEIHFVGHHDHGALFQGQRADNG